MISIGCGVVGVWLHMMQIKLSNEEADLLKKIEINKRYTIRKKNEKDLVPNLDRFGLILLEKNTKATYAISNQGREQLEHLEKMQLEVSEKEITTQSTDFSLIIQKLDNLKEYFKNDLKEVLKEYQDELKHYIDRELEKQNENILRVLELKKEKTIDENTFLEATREEYTKLAKTSPMAPYVSIKLLRDFVCKRLNFDETDFNVMLLSIANNDPYSVQLSTSGGEHGEGIIYGRSECHAAIIK